MTAVRSNVPLGCLVLQVIIHIVSADTDLAFRDTVILVADWGEPGRILNVSLQHMNFTTVPTELTLRPVAVDYDLDRDTLYWTDVLKHQIRSSDIRTGEDKVLAQLEEEATPDGLALDVGERLLFYTDAGRNLVVKLSLFTSWSDIIVHNNLHAPRAVVTYTEKRKIYWTDWGLVPKIETANYDGSSRTTLVYTELSWPNGLTIDEHNERLYWCDAKRNRIESILMDGSDRRLLLADPGAHFFDIFYHSGLLYFTDWANQHSLFHIPTSGGKKTYLKSGGFRHLAGLHVYSPSKSVVGRVATVKPSLTTNKVTKRVPTKTSQDKNVVGFVSTVKPSLSTNKATELVPPTSYKDAKIGDQSLTTGTVPDMIPSTTKKIQISHHKTLGVHNVTSVEGVMVDRQFQDTNGTKNRDVPYVTGNTINVTPVETVEGTQNHNHITFGIAAYVALGVVSFLLLLASLSLIIIYIKRQRKAKEVYRNLADVRPQCFNNNTYTLMSGDSAVYLVPVEESPKQDADHYYEDICELKSFMGKA